MTRDEARTKAVEALAMLGSTDDHDAREQYLTEVLWVVYQEGVIAANNEQIKRKDTQHK